MCFRGFILIGLLLLPVGTWAQQASWIPWARDHHNPILSIAADPDDTYADLEFLRGVLDGRRIVQLGESGHGVAEFSQAKIRLIKFMHERLGYDVLAFESGLFECYMANQLTGSGAQMMQHSIFGVWFTEDVKALFDYIKETQQTEHPLVLAGFDTQTSSSAGAAQRPHFLHSVVDSIDHDYAAEVLAFDTETLVGLRSGSAYAAANETRVVEFYERLRRWLTEHRVELEVAFPGDPRPMIAERAAFSVIQFVRQLAVGTNNLQVTQIRDSGMAENVMFLARQLYPNKKIMAWAHNFHIRHLNAAASGGATMGTWVAEQLRSELYTIGLFMNRGTAAWNDRSIYAIQPAPEATMEGVLSAIGPPVLFVDFLHQTRQAGNEWFFDRIIAREWGTANVRMVPRNQYDGVLFIDSVNPPTYVTVF
jgi:erythromycin esterase